MIFPKALVTKTRVSAQLRIKTYRHGRHLEHIPLRKGPMIQMLFKDWKHTSMASPYPIDNEEQHLAVVTGPCRALVNVHAEDVSPSVPPGAVLFDAPAGKPLKANRNFHNHGSFLCKWLISL